MQILLQHGHIAYLDDADYPLVASYHWYAQHHRHTWYALANVQLNDGTKNAQGRSRRKTIKMHSIILGAQAGEQIDHDDGNGLNNRRSNIAIVTHAQNQQNQHAARTNTGVLGVTRTKWGFRSQIKRGGRSIYLGTFNSIEDAAGARSSFSRNEQIRTVPRNS